jgi:prepilin-type N-terminal cleavage/methylation domain-containing protein
MKKAFTLVELSIVMVIIGLVMGMALKGKSLLDSATIRNEVNKLPLMQSAIAALLTTSSGDGYLSELPKDNKSKGYDFIKNDFLINKGLLSAKDISYNYIQHEIFFCANPTGTGFYGRDTVRTDNMLCAQTPNTWPLKFHCVAEVILDDQKVSAGKGRSDNSSDLEVGGVASGSPYDCNRSVKATNSYSYLLISNKGGFQKTVTP